MDKNNKLKLNAKDGGIAFSVMIVLYVLISFVGQVVLSAVCESGSVVQISISALFSIVAIILTCSAILLQKNAPIKETLSMEKFKCFSLLPAIMLAFGMFLGFGFINEAFAGIFKKWGLNVSGLVLPLENIGHFILFTIILAVFPAVVEELFFRGLMLSSLSGVKTVYAVLTVSICFALYHCSIAQFIYQLIYGAGLTILAIYAKSVFPCIIVHFINNFTVICCEYFKLSVNLLSPYIILIGIALLVGFSIIVSIKLKREPNKVNEKAMLKFWVPFGVFGAAVCLLIIISNLLVV